MLIPEDAITLSGRAIPWSSPTNDLKGNLIIRINQVQEASNVGVRKSINGHMATEAGLLENFVVKAVANAMNDAIIF